MSEQTRFNRNRTGSVVHMAGCKTRGEKFPWRWAEGKSDAEVANTVLFTAWLRPCQRCCGPLRDSIVTLTTPTSATINYGSTTHA